MKIAIIHDWFDTPGGAENVVENMLELYPDADLFSLVDFFSDENREKYLKGKEATTSFIQKLPFASTKFRNYLPLFPIAIEQFNLDKYDLVISSSHAVAKGVLTAPHQLHICYQYSPMRYAWDMYHTYFKEHNINGIKAFILRKVLHKIRIWDVVSSNRVDHFIAISTLIQDRIKKYYRRESSIIFPPVNTDTFLCHTAKEEFYFTAARLVPYKKVKLIVEAFNKNGKVLKVAGSGEQYEEIKQIAKSNIEILGYCGDDDMIKYMQKAKAFVYAAYEDFGIVPVEAMACGTPVIAYGKGGVLDSVKDGETGILFEEQTIESINSAIVKFENFSFNTEKISLHAKYFSSKRFKEEFKAFVDDKINNFLLK